MPPTRAISAAAPALRGTIATFFGNAEQLIISANGTSIGGSATTGLGYDTSVKFIKPDFGHRDQTLQVSVSAVKQFFASL